MVNRNQLLKQELEKGTITDVEYENLIKIRNSTYEHLCKSKEFLLWIIGIPVFNRVLFLIYFKSMMRNFSPTYVSLYNFVFTILLFLLYKLIRKNEAKTALWIWFIISITNLLLSFFSIF